jgi:Carboxypeptidase regulatory-like domain
MRFLILSSLRQRFRREILSFNLGLFLCLVCALAPLALAQTSGGSIVGTVSEWHGGPLSGASVTVSNTQTHAATSIATDVNGGFTVENLPAGDYKVTIAASGLVSEDKVVKVKPGHKSKLSVTLKPPAPPTPPTPPK